MYGLGADRTFANTTPGFLSVLLLPGPFQIGFPINPGQVLRLSGGKANTILLTARVLVLIDRY